MMGAVRCVDMINESVCHVPSFADRVMLRPPPFVRKTEHPTANTEPFRFSREPIVSTVEDHLTLEPEIESGEETPDDEHETRILSSWHHRALLDDDDRTLHVEESDS